MDYKQKIELEMEAALKDEQFQVYLQPKINMITSRIYGAEALVRWIHPVDGLRRPDTFIPVFEENGFIIQMDMYVFEQMCKLKARWHREKIDFASIPISVNMSRRHLAEEDFVQQLVDTAKKYDVDPFELDIEITESLYLKDHIKLTEVVNELQSHGFRVSIDDFGSGYSALNMLKDITVDTIKIDKEFLQLSGNSERGKKVIKNAIRLCKDLKFNVMVEGVETEEQSKFLVGYGCEIAQGFYYSMPIPINEFEDYINTHYMVTTDIVKFSFNDTLKSDDGRYEAEYVGDELRFVKGISPSVKAVHFPGGAHTENCLMLPTSIVHNDSYSISMWLKVDRLIEWSAAIFGEYENGFFQFCPLSGKGESCFRIRDRRYVEGWFDSISEPLKENQWYHIVIMYDRMAGRGSLYINGELAGSCEDVEALYFVKRLFVGSDIYKDSFEGSICEVMFSDRAMKKSEVEELYQEYVSKPDFDAFG